VCSAAQSPPLSVGAFFHAGLYRSVALWWLPVPIDAVVEAWEVTRALKHLRLCHLRQLNPREFTHGQLWSN